jgi:hypothetical protein
VGDFNGDGVLDLAFSTVTNFDETEGDFVLLAGNGNGTFTQKFQIPNPLGNAFAADFNGDGHLDLAGLLSFSSITPNPLGVLFGNGDGTFSLAAYPVGNVLPGQLVAADLNGRGLADLVGSGTQLETFLSGLSISGEASGIFLHGAGPHNIVATYSGDAVYSGSISPPIVVNNNTAEPTLSPAPGIYQWTHSVTIADATSDAAIYYTLDGTAPSSKSILYTTPIVVTWDATINAIAISPNSGASSVVTGIYSIDRPLPAPTFSPVPGTYPASQTITLTVDPSFCDHAICNIFYTLNGSTPTTKSPRYEGPISLAPGTATIKAFATSHHFVPGAVGEATYTIRP